MRFVFALVLLAFLWIGCVTESIGNQPTLPLENRIPTEPTAPSPPLVSPFLPEIVENDTEPNETTTVTIPETAAETPTPPRSEASKETEITLIQPELTYPDKYNGPLYDTSAQVGDSAPMDLFFENMDRNGVSFVLAFFAIDPSTLDLPLNNQAGLGYMAHALQKHPGRIVPFFSRGTGGEETDRLIGPTLTEGYRTTFQKINSTQGSHTLQGIGELEHYAWTVPVDDSRLLALYDVAAENNLSIMIHPKVGRYEQLKPVLERYPDTLFILHAFPEDFDRDKAGLRELLDEYENVYFGVEADHTMYYEGWGLLYKYQDDPDAVSEFKETFDDNFNTLLRTAKNRYQSMIESYPHRFFWGTELGTQYGHDPQVYDRTIKFTRYFIAELDPDVQEKFAYQNALRVLGPGVTLENDVVVLDLSDWPACTDAQLDRCDAQCGIEDPDAQIAEDEACLLTCLADVPCVEESN